ncbi:MAG: lytic transglycosylase domain-containing protein [Symbiobacterium sp.]|mgnify:CR=1 FL=1|uniref:lytic transglycosylase domain-containing protein n=1 Tax=Symbiobacterium sp. TaxID=1971213 RepID=UPI0034644A0E
MARRRRRRRRWLALAILVFALVLAARLALGRLYPLAYHAEISRCAAEHGLDPYLVVALIRAESRFRPAATSPQGARGLMQIMPETGRWVAEQMGLPFSPDSLYEPAYNIRVGCWYLAALLQEFAGDPVLALAAYNGGLGNVKDWLEQERWTGERHTLTQVPFAETRHYVAAVLRDQQRYRFLYGEWRWKAEGGDGHAEPGT